MQAKPVRCVLPHEFGLIHLHGFLTACLGLVNAASASVSWKLPHPHHWYNRCSIGIYIQPVKGLNRSDWQIVLENCWLLSYMWDMWPTLPYKTLLKTNFNLNTCFINTPSKHYHYKTFEFIKLVLVNVIIALTKHLLIWIFIIVIIRSRVKEPNELTRSEGKRLDGLTSISWREGHSRQFLCYLTCKMSMNKWSLFVQLFRHYKSPPFHTVICIHLISLSCHILVILPSHFSSMEHMIMYNYSFSEFRQEWEVRYRTIITEIMFIEVRFF